MSRMKIVATIGPRTDDEASVLALVGAGMDVARLNGSHADLAWHAATIALLRRVAPAIPILFDAPGRKIRTRQLAVEPTFAVGDELVLTSGEGDGRDGRVGVTSDTLHELLFGGERILADDGSLRFTVLRVEGRDVVCRAEIAGTLRSAKGINVPALNLSVDELTDRDNRVLDFAREQAVDFVGISFVDGKDLIDRVRAKLGAGGPRVVAKVESGNGMAHLEEIITAADVVMIDRGDLSVETNLEGIALAQKHIVSTATRLGKPVIIATEMLNSMIENSVPTKAEVTDISNAILDGASALMLSGETAIGKFPIQAVETMRRIAEVVAEAVVPPAPAASDDETLSVPRAMGEAVALVSRMLPVTKIVAITRSGYAARVVANFRPRQEILVVTDDPATARTANLLFGCRGVGVEIPFLRRSTDHIAACLEELWHRGLIVATDIVLVTSVGYPRSGRRMNLIQTHSVADLRETLGWAEPRGATAPSTASATDLAADLAAVPPSTSAIKSSEARVGIA